MSRTGRGRLVGAVTHLALAALFAGGLAACVGGGARQSAPPQRAEEPAAAVSATPPPTPSPAPPLPSPTAPAPTVPPTPSPSAPPSPTPAPAALRYGYPLGLPGRPPGDGFLIRHGAQVENTWYSPGNWHTGEDWYALEGDTGGAMVYAAAAGEVVYTGANYPGRVVIVAHPDGLYAMYGHLDPRLAVAVGEQVARGQPLGVVLEQRGARAPSHLHFEIRAFLTAREINGEAPRYGFRCGPGCPPGPGYWPIAAPDLPGERGWLNPTHVIARRMASAPAGAPIGEVVVASSPISPSLTLWSAPPDDPARRPLGEAALRPGERHALLAVWAGDEAPRETSALAYQLWYHVRLAGGEGWAQAGVPAADETGSDGRPASVRFNLLPAP